MTAPIDLDELERLLAAATPGEWESIAEVGVENFANSIYAPAGEWDGLLLARADQNGSTDNAALIVALHNSAPAMLTEIRELRAENARLKEALSHAQGRFLNINIALSSGGTKREAIRIADVGEDCAKNALARAALGEPQ